MIYELRIYHIAPGRMPSAIDRFERLPKIFAKLGFQLLGRWQALAGPQGPAIVYMIGFEDFIEREAQWASFYGDPDWLALRADSNDGEEMITRFDAIFLRPSPAWKPFAADAAVEQGGIHDLRIFQIGVGQIPRSHRFFEEVQLPAIAAAGGTTMMLADVFAGHGIPAAALITGWPDIESWYGATTALEADPAICGRYRADRGEPNGEAIGAWQHWLLRPLPAPYPHAALTLTSANRS